MTAVSQVPQHVAWTLRSCSTERSSICDRHSATSDPVSHAGPIGPRLTAAGYVALFSVPSSVIRSKQRIRPPAAHGMSPARIGSTAEMTPPRRPA